MIDRLVHMGDLHFSEARTASGTTPKTVVLRSYLAVINDNIFNRVINPRWPLNIFLVGISFAKQ